MKTEILAPAGAREQLEAAVRCGADAVYFGASAFNARRNADNFSGNDFISAVRFCHERNVKVYITLNTLVTDDEFDELYRTAELIALSGADGVIVQDLAVKSAMERCVPGLRIHASTQMAVHNLSGAKMLCDMGFSRIVLARELSISEIKKICCSVDCEIEVFVHGAHCMSASGLCYMSSAFGARSGNRGLCAQPCRLDFRTDERSYALSLKDMCLVQRLEELANAGVTSFKIEGRMKRPEYVGAAVTAYRNAADGISPDMDTLKSVFSRSGFTDGYAVGKRTLDMFGIRTKEDVTAAAGVFSKLKNLYKNEYKSVAVDMTLSVKANETSKLTLTDGENTVTVTGALPEAAVKTSLTPELAEKSLLKLGSTFYRPGDIRCDIDDGLILSAAAINAMRRDACDRLTEKRGACRELRFIPPADGAVSAKKSRSRNVRLSFKKASQIPDNVKCERLILPVREITEALIEKYGDVLCGAIPVLLYPADELRMTQTLRRLSDIGLKYALCDNIGAVAVAEKAGLTPVGGALLNVINSSSCEEYRKLGIDDITLSTEMSFELMRKGSFFSRIGFVAYGHMPLMHFRCCPMQGKNGCGDCPGERILTDRRGEPFKVLCEEKRFSVLYNPIPLYTGDKPMPNTDFVTLCFTYETKEECEKVTELFMSGEGLPCKRTMGLYDKKLL